VLKRINFGVGALGVSGDQEAVLLTTLGSCVAVIAIDPYARAAGLVHVALPDSSISPEKAATCPGYFADTGIPLLLREMARLRNREKSRLLIKLVGGARVLDPASTFDIGKRNVLATKKILWEHRLGVLAEDTGGELSRTVKVMVATGQVIVSCQGEETMIL
jgi:chemotaxis protein CheD